MPQHRGLPTAGTLTLGKPALLQQLKDVDIDKAATKRVLTLETDFRERMQLHLRALPSIAAKFAKFNTNPFVLMIHSLQNGYKNVSEIESDILPAKVFSSMETSAGRMVEAVVLPVYGWQVVPSEMHSVNSVLDGKRTVGDRLHLATLKSGPRCLNDEMSENIADAVLTNFQTWADGAGVKKVDFTYGVLYGTKKQSNKKDWHILRNIKEKLSHGNLSISPDGRWDCKFQKNGITVTVTIRIGVDLWNYIGGSTTVFMEMCSAIIRACITPSATQPKDHEFTIADLPAIISLRSVDAKFNVSLLQRSQLEWLFFFARHFCDQLTET